VTHFATPLRRRSRPRTLRPRLLLALAGVGIACAARQPPAAARPEASTAARRTSAAPAPLAISSRTADRVKLRWEAAPGGAGSSVAVSRALDRVAYSNGPEVLLFALGSGKPVDAGLVTCSPVIRGGLAFRDRQLVVVCQGAVKLRDAAGTPRDLPITAAPVTAAALAGDRLALAHRDGVVRIYPLAGGAPVEIPVPGPPIDVKSLALTADGARLAVAWVQGSIWWWDTAAPAAPHDLVRHDRESDTLCFSRDGTLLAEEGESFYTTVWSDLAGTPTAKARLRNGSWVKRLLFTQDGAWLVRGGSDGLELAEIAGPKRVVLDDRGSVEDVALSEDGTTLAAADREGRLTVWAVR
jgi:dipeptidyl aminopeptidase/acylaminoacyl peptidase